MDAGYLVSKRGPAGQPTEIRCTSHPDCSWTLASSSAQRDDDPILRAMFSRHLERRSDPVRGVVGHERRRK